MSCLRAQHGQFRLIHAIIKGMCLQMLIQLLHLSLYPRLRRFARAIKNPAEFQRERLRAILGANASSVFGKELGFAGITDPDTYRRTVPIRPFAGFEPYIERMKNGEGNVLVSAPVSMFGVTSGSTASPKFIPVTRAFTLEHHLSHLAWLYGMLSDHPGSTGHALSIVSPAQDGVTTGGTPYGSSSGKQYRDQSIPIRMMHRVPYEVFECEGFLEKYYCTLLYAMSADLRTVTSVNPSTLVMMAQLLNENAEGLLSDLKTGRLDNAPGLDAAQRARFGRKLRANPALSGKLHEIWKAEGQLFPRDIWRNLRVINTWQGGNAPFYLDKLRRYWGADVPQRCLGLRATEGIFSVPLSDNTASGVLAVGSHFLEFIEGEQTPEAFTPTLLAHELEVGKRYRLVITTSGGLYRYDLGDVIEVTGWRENTPEVCFLHKAGGVLSVTGEKVCEDQVVEAMAHVERENFLICGFSVSIELNGVPRYVLAVETACHELESAGLRKAGEDFDRELSRINLEYRQKRQSGRLGMPLIVRLKQGSYRDYRQMLIRQGRPDGQIKPPHILKPAGEGLFPVAGCPFFDYVEIVERVQTA